MERQDSLLEVYEIPIEEEIATECSKARILTKRPLYSTPFRDSDLSSIESQIITPRYIAKQSKLCTKIRKETMLQSPKHLDVQMTKFDRMEGTLETKFIENDGYFMHTFRIEKNEETSDSFLYGRLKLRNGDQLLTINDIDVTLKSHSSVSHLLTSNFSNDLSNISENISMEYYKASDNNYHRITLGDGLMKLPTIELETITSHWKLKKVVHCFKLIGSNRYLQTTEDDKIVMKKNISSFGVKVLADFHKCHFKVESQLGKKNMKKRYIAEVENKYIYVTKEGHAELGEEKDASEFDIKATQDGFVTIQVADRYLFAENLMFMPLLNRPREVPRSCKFELDIIICSKLY